MKKILQALVMSCLFAGAGAYADSCNVFETKQLCENTNGECTWDKTKSLCESSLSSSSCEINKHYCRDLGRYECYRSKRCYWERHRCHPNRW